MMPHTAPEFNQMERVGKILHAYKKKKWDRRGGVQCKVVY